MCDRCMALGLSCVVALDPGGRVLRFYLCALLVSLWEKRDRQELTPLTLLLGSFSINSKILVGQLVYGLRTTFALYPQTYGDAHFG